MARHLQIDADPDPAYHFDADPDADPELFIGFLFEVDAYPGYQMMLIRADPDADPDPRH